jgi:hypothetical protein
MTAMAVVIRLPGIVNCISFLYPQEAPSMMDLSRLASHELKKGPVLC